MAAAVAACGLAVGTQNNASTLENGPAVEPQKEQRSAIGLRARTDVRQMLRSSRPAVSSLSAAIPYAASCRTAAPGAGTLLSRADVGPCEAATDLAKAGAWPDTEGVTGSNPVAPTSTNGSLDSPPVAACQRFARKPPNVVGLSRYGADV
jgi:hypothetical protein